MIMPLLYRNRPFPKPTGKQHRITVMNHYSDEFLKVFGVAQVR